MVIRTRVDNPPLVLFRAKVGFDFGLGAFVRLKAGIGVGGARVMLGILVNLPLKTASKPSRFGGIFP